MRLLSFLTELQTVLCVAALLVAVVTALVLFSAQADCALDAEGGL